MISKKEKEALESSFQLLDKNCDGQISKVELDLTLILLFMSVNCG